MVDINRRTRKYDLVERVDPIERVDEIPVLWYSEPYSAVYYFKLFQYFLLGFMLLIFTWRLLRMILVIVHFEEEKVDMDDDDDISLGSDENKSNICVDDHMTITWKKNCCSWRRRRTSRSVEVLVEEVDGDTENAEEEEYIEGSFPTSMNHEDE